MTTEKSILPVPEEPVSVNAEDVKTTQETQNVVEEPCATTEDATQDQVEEIVEQEVVDFSDEDAQLAAESPEFDLGEEIVDEQSEVATTDVVDITDLSGKSKAELVVLFEQQLNAKPVQSLRRDVEAIKIAFYKLHRTEFDAAKAKFIETGGNVEEFVMPVDNAEQKLKELFGEYRKKRDEFVSTIEHLKEGNLQIKLKIIEDLKELINSGETLDHTFSIFRDLQQRWRDTGLIPQANVKDLWETYNLYVERFYDFIKINKELRDLDLKKNYEAKMALCEEADALILEPSIVIAFHKLQKLHEQWRETGPVANEYKESLWDRFKEASSRVNKQHQDYFEQIKDEQKRNFDLKSELCVKTEELANSPFTTRKEWNKASDKLVEIQKVWKTIGFAPKKDNAKVYERFRNACDKFFEHKRSFYLQIQTEMEHNLQLKNEICEIAEALRESEQWKKTTEELITLQKKWKEIGPVSRRYSDTIWKRFRAACDAFFAHKSTHFSSVDAQHTDNLNKKRELLAEIEACNIFEGGFDAIKEYQRRWSEIGFVPIKEKDAIQSQYKVVMDKLFATLRGNDRERQIDKFKSKITTMKGGGDRKLRFERERLYNKVRQLEADIALLENNIGFFSKSKNAESMIKDVKDKIAKAKQEMVSTIEMVKMIDNNQETEKK